MNAIASKIPEPVRQLCATLRQHGKRAWVVGGCVRDMLLDRPIHDFDLCTDALPREVQKIFPKVIPTGIEHGTVTVVVKGVHYEITTLRGETTYSDGRRPDGVEFINDINADLARRDFTVNAIAYDLTTEHLVDPFGGQQDLENRRLRAVGHAHERFAEDGLRVLRAARFVATLEMTLDESTEKAIRPSLDTYRKVSAERIHDEWIKTMKAARPSRAFDVMQRTGILGVSCPEIDATAGLHFGESDKHGDAWAHAQRTLDEVKGDPILKLASLFLHVGRPRTVSAAAGKFSDHERIGADLADTILVRLKFSNDERARIRHLVLHQNPGYSSDWTDAQIRHWLRKVGTDRLDDLFTMMRASHRATYASVPREERSGENDSSHDPRLEELVARVKGILDAKHPLTSKSLAINGGDLMRELNWAPGKRIGETLEKLLDLVTESPDLNTRERLLDAARAMTP